MASGSRCCGSYRKGRCVSCVCVLGKRQCRNCRPGSEGHCSNPHESSAPANTESSVPADVSLPDRSGSPNCTDHNRSKLVSRSSRSATANSSSQPPTNKASHDSGSDLTIRIGRHLKLIQALAVPVAHLPDLPISFVVATPGPLALPVLSVLVFQSYHHLFSLSLRGLLGVIRIPHLSKGYYLMLTRKLFIGGRTALSSRQVVCL